jgi:hypothetical protein
MRQCPGGGRRIADDRKGRVALAAQGKNKTERRFRVKNNQWITLGFIVFFGGNTLARELAWSTCTDIVKPQFSV